MKCYSALTPGLYLCVVQGAESYDTDDSFELLDSTSDSSASTYTTTEEVLTAAVCCNSYWANQLTQGVCRDISLIP
jgi:hypothetical protein